MKNKGKQEQIKENISKEDIKRIKRLENNIGYKFKDKQLALTAITHKSYSNEHHVENNERLEFLGDSVLAYTITNELFFKKTNDKAEGDMTKIRSYIVCEEALYEVAEKIDGREIIRTGKSHENIESLSKAILADMIEAIIAAVYCDSNLHQAKILILKFLNEKIEEALESKYLQDYKTVFQEMMQAKGIHEISYEIISSTGPDHDKNFVSELKCNGRPVSVGRGKTKKSAETEAARIAIEELKNSNKGKSNKKSKNNDKSKNKNKAKKKGFYNFFKKNKK